VVVHFVLIQLFGTDEMAVTARTDPVVIPSLCVEYEFPVKAVFLELLERRSAVAANIR